MKQLEIEKVTGKHIEHFGGTLELRTYHANRVATFFGPHTGFPARQLGGAAGSPWRVDDEAMLRAIRRLCRCADVHLT